MIKAIGFNFRNDLFPFPMKTENIICVEKVTPVNPNFGSSMLVYLFDRNFFYYYRYFKENSEKKHSKFEKSFKNL